MLFLSGCWLFLHSIDHLQPSILQATCSLLSLIRQRRHKKEEASLEWMGEKITLSTDDTGICFASINTPLTFPDYSLPPVFPTSLAAAFKPCSVETPDMVEILKVMFTTHHFENAASLANSLFTFCGALEELSRPLLPQGTASGSTDSYSSRINLNWLEKIVSLSRKHMNEFYSLGAISTDDDQPVAGDGLHVSSMVYSEISESTRASIKGRQSAGTGEDDASQQKLLQRQSLEEFSVVLSLKDCVLCSVVPSSREYNTTLRLLTDVFSNCDIEGLLAHEANVREGMALKARENREAVESARESRAASVMQMMREESCQSEGKLVMMSYFCFVCQVGTTNLRMGLGDPLNNAFDLGLLGWIVGIMGIDVREIIMYCVCVFQHFFLTIKLITV